MFHHSQDLIRSSTDWTFICLCPSERDESVGHDAESTFLHTSVLLKAWDLQLLIPLIACFLFLPRSYFFLLHTGALFETMLRSNHAKFEILTFFNWSLTSDQDCMYVRHWRKIKSMINLFGPQFLCSRNRKYASQISW